MSDLDLEELERLDAAATPGPWEAGAAGFIRGGDSRVAITESTRYYEDAALIAALRNSAPALLAAAREGERLRALLEESRTVVAAWIGAGNDGRPMRELADKIDSALAGIRDRLVLVALDAGATPASLSPLTQEERVWVRKTLEEFAGKRGGNG